MSQDTDNKDTKRPMRVTFVSHSDLIGGASVVTFRLMNALRALGVDARMIVYTKISDSPYVDTLSSRFMRGFKFMAERARIALSNGLSRKDLFKVSIANTGLAVYRHPWIVDADVVALGWINQGLLSLSGIKKLGRLGKPLVWVMHDMWCLTGICHHAYECDAYTEQCGNCPFLGAGAGEHDLSWHVHNRKASIYPHLPITFVAVSRWLAERAAQSSLLRNADVRVIPNAFPLQQFSTVPEHPSTLAPQGRDLIVMGAARLDDPVKGLQYAVDALNHLFDNRPDVARRATAVFFGSIRNRSIIENIRFPHVFIDRVNDPRLLRDLYASAKVVLSSSLYETLPGTLIEGQASGCLPVTFGRGGQRDIITHLKDGYIAAYKDPVSLAEGIIWALDTPVPREQLRASVQQKFDAPQVARQYINLFEELLSAKA